MTSFQLGTFALILAFQLIGCLTSEKLFAEYPLTWEILENDLSERFLTRLKCGPNRATKRLGKGETKGLMSKVFCVTFDWQNATSKEGLPRESAVKIISLDDMKRLYAMLNQSNAALSPITYAAWAHDQELFLYGNISEMGLINELRFPIFYAGKPFDYTTGWGYLSIEFIGNVTIKHIYDDFSDSEILQGLELLAKMNGISLRKREKFSKFVQSHLYDVYIQSAFSRMRLPFLQKFLKRHQEKSEEIGKLLKILATFDDEDGFKGKLERNCPIKMVTHGDLWPPNVFWSSNGNDVTKLRAIVDFQYTHFGNPLFDIVKWFFFTIKPEDYNLKRDRFLHYYYEKLKQEAQDERIPWDSYKEFLKQYEVMYLWKAVEASHTIDLVQNQMINELPASQRLKYSKLFEDRYLVMLAEASRIFDERKADVL